jgi:rubrerythrin
MADHRQTVVVETVDQLLQTRSRRDFLRLLAAGGAAVLLPGVFAACDDDDDGPAGLSGGTGGTVTLDFSDVNDVGVLNYAYALEQLEAAFYAQVVARSGAALTADEANIMADIRNHEAIHAAFFRQALGTAAIGTLDLSRTFTSIDFANRAAVLTAARDFEDTGVAAYNGAAQYLKQGANVLTAGKIVSVEARHAAVIRDMLDPTAQAQASAAFAPRAFDEALDVPVIVGRVEDYIVQRLEAANKPEPAQILTPPDV